MKKLILSAAFLIPFFFLAANGTSNGPTKTNNNPNNYVKFHTGSFESGLSKASAENKYLFVEFYADWCTPCKWMDKTTFRDEKVVDAINTSFVALKLDIETDEGAGLKHQYSVRMLPTILIFNANGEIIDRVEKTLSSESMLSLLSFHNLESATPMATPTPVNSSPQDREYSRSLDKMYSKYVSSERNRTNYKVQIANYTDYTQAFKKVNELGETFMEPIVVVNDYVDNTTHYKVLMGEFKTMEEAESFRKILKRDFGIDGILH